MNFKKTFLAICLIVCLFVMAGICASAVNQADFDSDFNKSNSKCASFIIQEENGIVFAFRQDAPADEDGVVIHNDTLGDLEVIVQEIDAPDSHFIHSIITQDGWVFSHGGDSSNDSDVQTIERIAGEMLVSKKISSNSLGQIQKIFQKYNYSHFLIKAPDGRYGVVFSENYTLGNLNQGEYLVVPNEYAGFRNGNLSNYSKDPVDAIIDICSYEDSGWNRRNIYTYDYNVNFDSNEQKSGVDVYVTNDNGHNVGLNTSEIVTYCYFNDEFYPASEIPQNPDKLHIGNYTFENQSFNPLLEVFRNLNNALVNINSPYAMN